MVLVRFLLTGLGGWERGRHRRLPPDRSVTFRSVRHNDDSVSRLRRGDLLRRFRLLCLHRAGSWPPAHVPPCRLVVVIYAALLLASSVTLHYGHEALEDGNRRPVPRPLGVTLALGVVFLAGQVYEYYEFVAVEGSASVGRVRERVLRPDRSPRTARRARRRAARYRLRARAPSPFAPARHGYPATSLYWHFVDLVWVFLVVVLYVGAAL